MGSEPVESALAARTGAALVELVDGEGRTIGTGPKLDAHLRPGRLHRAVSVLLLDERGRLLLQRRADGKYHFGGLWTNACCSHPRSGQDLLDAAHARLRHEFGFDAPLRHLFSFVYRADDPASGLTEHEFDHVFVGRFDGTPRPNPEEIGHWQWVEPAELLADVERSPQRYTPWFKLVLNRVMQATR